MVDEAALASEFTPGVAAPRVPKEYPLHFVSIRTAILNLCYLNTRTARGDIGVATFDAGHQKLSATVFRS